MGSVVPNCCMCTPETTIVILHVNLLKQGSRFIIAYEYALHKIYFLRYPTLILGVNFNLQCY